MLKHIMSIQEPRLELTLFDSNSNVLTTCPSDGIAPSLEIGRCENIMEGLNPYPTIQYKILSHNNIERCQHHMVSRGVT